MIKPGPSWADDPHLDGTPAAPGVGFPLRVESIDVTLKSTTYSSLVYVGPRDPKPERFTRWEQLKDWGRTKLLRQTPHWRPLRIDWAGLAKNVRAVRAYNTVEEYDMVQKYGEGGFQKLEAQAICSNDETSVEPEQVVRTSSPES